MPLHVSRDIIIYDYLRCRIARDLNILCCKFFWTEACHSFVHKTPFKAKNPEDCECPCQCEEEAWEQLRKFGMNFLKDDSN